MHQNHDETHKKGFVSELSPQALAFPVVFSKGSLVDHILHKENEAIQMFNSELRVIHRAVYFNVINASSNNTCSSSNGSNLHHGGSSLWVAKYKMFLHAHLTTAL